MKRKVALTTHSNSNLFAPAKELFRGHPALSAGESSEQLGRPNKDLPQFLHCDLLPVLSDQRCSVPEGKTNIGVWHPVQELHVAHVESERTLLACRNLFVSVNLFKKPLGNSLGVETRRNRSAEDKSYR
jgi:hypothetical protein